jgi:hypothetical protein
MSAEQAPGGSARNVREVLDLTLAQAREADRDDLVLRLTAARRLLMRSELQVRVSGVPGQGKSALIEALMSGPISDAVTYEDVGSTTVGAGSMPGPDVECAHLELYVVGASRPLSDPEVEEVKRTQDRCPNIFLVMNRIDQNVDWRDVLEQNRSLLTGAGIYVEMPTVSAAWRMQAGWSGDRELADRSGVPALRAELGLLGADLERLSVQVAVHHVLTVLAELERMLKQRRVTLSAVGGLERARERYRLLEQRAEALRLSAARCPVVISGNAAALQGDIALDLRQRMQGLNRELDQTLQSSSPKRQWPALTGWLYELVIYEAELNRQCAIAGGARISATAAGQLGIAAPHQLAGTHMVGPGALDPPPAADVALPRVRPVNISVLFGVMMRVWVGFAIFFTLSAAAKLHPAPIAAVIPMLIMATLGTLEERRRWRERRRAHASTALRGYISDVTARVNKDGNDLVRGIESELRESYGGWFEREREALATQRAAAQRDLRAIERSPKLLGEIEDRLRDYAELKRRAKGIIPARLLAG